MQVPFDLLRRQTAPDVMAVADQVWEKRDHFIRWPREALLLMPGIVRIPYHTYSDELKAKLRAAKVAPDSRSNGPAIAAFLLAGGERPTRTAVGRSWSVHHIYDGQFPVGDTILRAVTDGRYFTHSAGLVAVHPLADALADEVPYFAWLLRLEAFRRFRFDPDHVFSHE
ncbi:hypothetical protein ED208_11935 [Stagnimonas aquatica]|uniref:Uncharacterized protein n=1 Tax=Stagnimonas aquatica TaxID=2689987 RepID=A0A3N0V8M6_9GAMM|nr:hypothetical protein [Stagnimonas aquatica]ROH89113.1 hypothetical protein ED208_11935 [Stagnimonas aquatica]